MICIAKPLKYPGSPRGIELSEIWERDAFKIALCARGEHETNL